MLPFIPNLSPFILVTSSLFLRPFLFRGTEGCFILSTSVSLFFSSLPFCEKPHSNPFPSFLPLPFIFCSLSPSFTSNISQELIQIETFAPFFFFFVKIRRLWRVLSATRWNRNLTACFAQSPSPSFCCSSCLLLLWLLLFCLYSPCGYHYISYLCLYPLLNYLKCGATEPPLASTKIASCCTN